MGRRRREREGLAQEGEGRDEAEGKDKGTDAEVHLSHRPRTYFLSTYGATFSRLSDHPMQGQGGLTSEVPQVSALANSRGKAGKSTAKMHKTVMTIMMAR
jgi:hypothetical protein